MAGLDVRTRRVLGAPVVALRAWIPGGARVEPIPGLARVTGRLLAEGTRRRDFKQISDDAEAVGASVESHGAFEHHRVVVDALADDWERACEWLAELVLEPSFAADRTDWSVRQSAAELDSLADRPDVRTVWAFLDQLYAPHPRCRPLQGTAGGLAAITPEAAAAFHAARRDHGIIVTAAGSLDEDALAARLRDLFGELGTAAGDPEVPAPSADGPMRRQVDLPTSDQAHLFLGHLTVPRAHEDFEALELAGVALGAGAGLTGRIPERIREREGLAYTARGQTVAGCGLDPGRLTAYVGTAPETVARAETGVREELARLVEDGLSDDEHQDCKAYLLGRAPFERETARQWADLLAVAAFYGLPVDQPGWREQRLEKLTRADVEAAVRRHLDPEKLRVTVGLPG
jgi:zinc protease